MKYIIRGEITLTVYEFSFIDISHLLPSPATHFQECLDPYCDNQCIACHRLFTMSDITSRPSGKIIRTLIYFYHVRPTFSMEIQQSTVEGRNMRQQMWYETNCVDLRPVKKFVWFIFKWR